MSGSERMESGERFGGAETLEEFEARLMEIEALRQKLLSGDAQESDLWRLWSLEALDEREVWEEDAEPGEGADASECDSMQGDLKIDLE